MFKKASQLKLRFSTDKGNVSVEDLWDLPLTSASGPSLQSVARALGKQLETDDEVDYVGETTPQCDELALKLDIVKSVIASRKDANAEIRNATAKRNKNQKILAVLARKEDDDLENMSADELRALLASG
jgi:hypothetical protein